MDFYLPASPRTGNPRGASWDTLTRTRENELLQCAMAPALPKRGSDPGKASAQTSLSWGAPSSHGTRNTCSFVLFPVAPTQGQISISQLPPRPDSQFPEGKAGSERLGRVLAHRRHFEICPVDTTCKPVSGKRHPSSLSTLLVSPQVVKIVPPTGHPQRFHLSGLGAFWRTTFVGLPNFCSLYDKMPRNVPQKTLPFPISPVAKGTQKTQFWSVSCQQNLQELQGEFF